MSLNRILVACLVAGVSVGTLARPADTDAGQAARSVPAFAKFQQWARLVRTHTPGQWDVAARAVAAWAGDDLQLLQSDLEAIASLLAWQSTSSEPAAFATLRPTLSAAREASYRRATHAELAGGKGLLRVLRLRDLPALMDLPPDRALPVSVLASPRSQDEFTACVRVLAREVTRFMQRAAALHVDIAALTPTPVTHGTGTSRSDGSQSVVMRVVDGQSAGLDEDPVHWEIARVALDAVRPDPSVANEVQTYLRAWYYATSAHLLSRRAYGYAGPHLQAARTKLGDDARIELFSGVREENQGSPSVQAALQSVAATGVQLNIASVRESLGRAEGYFQHAIERDPTLTVALVHHARVMGLLGRHDAAVGELRQAIPSITDAVQAYYVALFLGVEEHALGHSEMARGAFTRAAALFPQAQSPLLALGQLAWESGDRTSAFAALNGLVKLPGTESERMDPWWIYDVSTALDHNALMAELSALVGRTDGK